MRVVVAPDSFKGSLDAAGVARALAHGWRSVRPGDEVVEVPLADGGEGSLEVLAAAVPGARVVPVAGVSGPDGRLVDAAWLALPDGTAVVELARSSGLPLMSARDARGAHTLGLGQVMLAAAAHPGTRRLVVALGGSASTDGGTGALRALGLRLLDAAGAELPLGGGSLARLTGVVRGGLVRLPPVSCLVDVTNPLLGPSGAAAVFGPQKGASPEDVAHLEAGLARLAQVLGAQEVAALPGAGAAGGTAFGLAAVLGARLEPGAARLAELAGLGRALEGARLVLTGEGSFDAQSLGGKVVGEVLARAARTGVPAAVVAGRAPEPDLVPGLPVATLLAQAGSAEAALSEPARWAAAAAAALARAWQGAPWGPAQSFVTGE